MSSNRHYRALHTAGALHHFQLGTPGPCDHRAFRNIGTYESLIKLVQLCAQNTAKSLIAHSRQLSQPCTPRIWAVVEQPSEDPEKQNEIFCGPERS